MIILSLGAPVRPSFCRGLALLATLIQACASTPIHHDSHAAPENGDPAPEFSVTDQRGRDWTLVDSFQKPLLVDLWATWCAPCLQALPDLQRLSQTHAGRLTVLGLATDQQGWAVVTPVIHRYQVTYPVAVINPSLSNAFGAKAYPYLVLVHRGKVLKRLSGRHNYADLERELAPWLR